MVQSDTGALYVTLQTFDYETDSYYDLKVRLLGADDASFVTLSINIIDIDEHNLHFINEPYESVVMEYSPVGTLIAVLEAESDASARLSYSISGSTTEELAYYMSLFSMDTDDGTITVKRVINLKDVEDDEYLRHNTLTIPVSVSDGVATDSSTVSVQIEPLLVKYTNANDSRYYLNLPEDTVAGKLLFNLIPSDPGFEKEDYEYKVVGASAYDNFPFAVNADTGEMTTNYPVDREMQEVYLFSVIILEIQCLTGREPYFEIRIDDVNDQTPFFLESTYTATIQEDAGSSGEMQPLVVAPPITAKDNDIGINADIRYSLTGQGSESFIIDPKNATVWTKENPNIDYENTTIYHLKVTATDLDGSVEGLSNTADFIISISDVNDNKPIFYKSSWNIVIMENVPIGTTLDTVYANDADSGLNGEVLYNINSGGNGRFKIDLTTGKLSTLSDIDRESEQFYHLTIAARDQGFPVQVSEVDVYITVEDENDNPPVFSEQFYIEHVPEITNPGSLIATISASDSDEGMNGEFNYQIVEYSSQSAGLFTIASDGGIYLMASLDRETADTHSLQVGAVDAGTPALSSSVRVTIVVDDNNDNSPIFSQSLYTSTVVYQPTIPIETGTLVTVVIATDDDVGTNADITYNLQPFEHGDHFEISRHGVIRIKDLFYPSRDEISFNVTATDGGIPPIQDSATIDVLFLQSSYQFNFNATMYHFSVRENQANSMIGRVHAMSELLSHLVYYLPFEVDGINLNNETGLLSTTAPLDRESNSQIVFSVLAKHGDGTDGYAFATVNITVEDENDVAPRIVFPSEPIYFLTIPENTPARSLLILQAEDDDYGSNAKIEFSILDGNKDYSFDITVSGALSVIDVDRERDDLYELVIMARDSGDVPLNSTVSIIIDVLDENDNVPIIWTEPTLLNIPENILEGTLVTNIQGSDDDIDENAVIIFKLQDDSNGTFSIDELSGSVRTAKTIDREMKDAHTIIVVARDNGTLSLSSLPLTIDIQVEDINDNAPHFQGLPYVANIRKDSPPETYVMTASAKDADVGKNANLTFRLTSLGDCMEDLFEINTTTAEIHTTDFLYEVSSSSCHIDIVCMDDGDQPLMSTTDLVVNIVQVNRPPRFESNTYKAFIYENAGVGTRLPTRPVGRPMATDSDEGSNAVIIYEIIAGNEDGLFQMDPGSGEMYVKQELDRERIEEVTIVIEAHDANMFDRQSATALLIITIGDVNDNGPKFKDYIETVVVPQISEAGHTVAVMETSDPDSYLYAECRFSIMVVTDLGNRLDSSKFFEIDEDSGTITTTEKLYYLNFLSTINIQLIVSAENKEPMAPGSPENRRDYARIIVNFKHSYTPRCGQDEYIVNIRDEINSESSLNITIEPGNTAEPKPELMYAIKSGNTQGAFRIHPQTGEVFVGETTRTFYNLTISVRTRDRDISDEEGLCSVLVSVITSETTVPMTTSGPGISDDFSREAIIIIIVLVAVIIITWLLIIMVTIIYLWQARKLQSAKRQRQNTENHPKEHAYPANTPGFTIPRASHTPAPTRALPEAPETNAMDSTQYPDETLDDDYLVADSQSWVPDRADSDQGFTHTYMSMRDRQGDHIEHTHQDSPHYPETLPEPDYQ
ncbi:protocadherin Fat 4-like [Ptychodera flava]|uniref:protocadherin Fat 4-like n=1 Tax=Ptychodera flava TaxID=63121 RepID=UPI00396A1B10